MCWGVAAWVSPATAQEPLSESDYFQQLPVVLTVSRLDQSIGDTPGAVTVIDREGKVRGMFDATSISQSKKLRLLLLDCLAEKGAQ